MTALRAVVSIGLLAALAACAPSADLTPATDDQKALYEIGHRLSQSIAPFELDDEELDYVALGLREGATGQERRVDSAESLRAFIEARQGAVAARQGAQSAAEKQAGAAFAAQEAAEPGAQTLETGLVFRLVSEAEGPKPEASDTVKVHYHGTLRDGTVFDSSKDRGEPAVFPVGRVIPCWQQALLLMPEGSTARVVCPSEIAYGDSGSPPTIKPGATLAFDVELIEIVKKVEIE